MKTLLQFSLVLCSFIFLQSGNAQYCTPPVTTGGIWISYAGFSNIPGGTNFDSSPAFNSEGYANRSGSSAATVNRNCTNNYAYNLQSCGNQGIKNFNFHIYADWNQDNDFDDANELVADISNILVNGNCAFYGSSATITIPENANEGNIRMRWTLREGGSAATACGGYTGEIEDYTITVAANTAPVLNNSATPVLNPLVETQTNNNGMLITRFLQTTQPAVTVITESDACTSQKGIAVIGTSNPNGSWQYKIASGSWTNIGVVSSANALLLNETNRVRFVPTGPGTADITFQAWDKTVSTIGQYYNITATGGATAFSANTETTSIETYSAASAAADKTIYFSTLSSAGSDFNIVTSSLSPSTGIFKHLNSITSDNLSGYGYDIALDEANNKLYWVGGADGVSLMSSDINGSNIQTLIPAAFSYPTGIAIGGNKVFIADYGVALYSANLDGTGFTAITGGAGQANNIGDLADIEYYNGKIYYFNQPGYAGGFKIFEANADGTGTVELLALDNYPYGLDAVNGNLYWTETDFTSSYVLTRPISGGSVTTLATESGRNFYDLMADPSNSKIYFTDISNSSTAPLLKSIPLAGGAITQELVLENTYLSPVFSRNLTTLPVHFINIKAWTVDSRNMVEWNIAGEENVSHYVVERSADGRNFTDAGTVTAAHSNRYQWPDAHPLAGNNFYRIRAVDHDGKKLYSAVVLVNRDEKNKSIAVYPTVISNDQFALRLQNIAAGSYQVQVINSTGQQVYTQRIMHNGGSSVQNINLPALAKGIYRVAVTGNTEIYTTGILLQ